MPLDTTPAPSVSAAMESRITCRAFLDMPVSDTLLKTLVARALRSPSGGNLQPWKLHVMTGSVLEAFRKTATERTLSGKLEEPTHPAYPPKLWEPHRTWRYKLGEDMYALLGIERDNKMGRMAWLAENAKFFGAPVGIIVTGDKRMNMPQHMDIGILLQSLMLLAREEGLHTAPQGWWRNWSSVAEEHLDIPDSEEVYVGLALGYGDPDHAVNDLRADRAEMDEVVRFYP